MPDSRSNARFRLRSEKVPLLGLETAIREAISGFHPSSLDCRSRIAGRRRSCMSLRSTFPGRGEARLPKAEQGCDHQLHPKRENHWVAGQAVDEYAIKPGEAAGENDHGQ